MINQDKVIRKLAIRGATFQEIANKTNSSITWIRDYLISIKLNDIRVRAKRERKYQIIKEKDKRQVVRLAMEGYWSTKIREKLKEQYPLNTIISFLKDKNLFIDGRSLWKRQRRHVRQGVLNGVNEGLSINIIAALEEISKQGVSYHIKNYNLYQIWREKRATRLNLERQLQILYQYSSKSGDNISQKEKGLAISDLEKTIESLKNQ